MRDGWTLVAGAVSVLALLIVWVAGGSGHLAVAGLAMLVFLVSMVTALLLAGW